MSSKRHDPHETPAERIASDLGSIKTNIEYIKDIADKYREDFEQHVIDDRKIHDAINKNTILTGILWAVFGLASLTVLAQNILAHVKPGA